MNGLIELGIINKDGYERDNRVYFRGGRHLRNEPEIIKTLR